MPLSVRITDSLQDIRAMACILTDYMICTSDFSPQIFLGDLVCEMSNMFRTKFTGKIEQRDKCANTFTSQ